jgi:hypothetical protein
VQVQANVYELRLSPKLVLSEAAPAVLIAKPQESGIAESAAISAVQSSKKSNSVVERLVMVPAAAPLSLPKKRVPLKREPKVLIANGKGEGGLACREAKGLAVDGWKFTGCIDHANFSQKHSVIYFLRGQEDAAKKVHSSLLKSSNVELRRVNALSRGADVQVLIGHDWPRVRATLRSAT